MIRIGSKVIAIPQGDWCDGMKGIVVRIEDEDQCLVDFGEQSGQFGHNAHGIVERKDHWWIRMGYLKKASKPMVKI